MTETSRTSKSDAADTASESTRGTADREHTQAQQSGEIFLGEDRDGVCSTRAAETRWWL